MTENAAATTSNIVLTPGGTLALLFTPKEVVITCGEVKIKVKGTVLSPLSGTGEETTQLTSLTAESLGNGKGVPNATKYLNNTEGKETTAELLGNFGTGFVKSAEEFTEEKPKATAGEGKMFTILTR